MRTSGNGYGSVDLDASGNWTYTLDNSDPTVQALSGGETLADSFTAVSADGTSQVVSITITGTNDSAVIGGDIAGAVTEESSLTDSGTLTISVDGETIASGEVAQRPRMVAGNGETFDTGRDTNVPVSPDYQREGAFTGELDKVTVKLKMPGAG